MKSAFLYGILIVLINRHDGGPVKKTYLYCTRLRVYWVLIPILAILISSIIINPHITTFAKLYPLIIISSGGLIFTLIFLFRMIEISYQEIRHIGRFSPRDSAEITEGKTLVLLPGKHGVVRLKLMAVDTLPEYSWMKKDDGKPRVVCMFRGKTYGGKRNIRRVLKFFGVTPEDIDKIISEDDFSGKFETVDVKAFTSGEEQKEIHITVKVTV